MRKNQIVFSSVAPGRTRIHLLGFLLTALLCLGARPAGAQVAVGASAGEFLGFEIGASSAGLAGANTSVASGVSSQFWNPSLLAEMSRPQASMMHATWLGDLQYEWIGYARPLGLNKGVGSLSVAYFHMPSVSGVDEFDNPTGSFRVYDMAFTAGYARPVVKGLMLGVNGKMIRQTLASASGTGAAVDLGASARIAGATVGATIQNLGPSISFGGGSYPLPQQTRFGISRPFLADRLLLAADYNMPRAYYNDVRVGAEIRPNSTIALRVGYRRESGTKDDPSTGFSFGLGAHVGPLNLDYAMTPSNGFSDIHRMSFGYTFGSTGTKEPRHQPGTPPNAPKGPPVIVSAPAPQTGTSVSNSAPAPRVAAAPAKAAVPATKQAVAPRQGGPDAYEVVLGNYQSETSAQAELKAIRILGFSLKDAIIQFVPGTGYRLSLVRYNSRKSADELAASLNRLSFAPRVEIARR
jgi:hypothetical protein